VHPVGVVLQAIVVRIMATTNFKVLNGRTEEHARNEIRGQFLLADEDHGQEIVSAAALVNNVVSSCISSLRFKTNLKHGVELMEGLFDAAGDFGPAAVL